jgi:hypothetical protein
LALSGSPIRRIIVDSVSVIVKNDIYVNDALTCR